LERLKQRLKQRLKLEVAAPVRANGSIESIAPTAERERGVREENIVKGALAKRTQRGSRV